jgi:hypothetical protein
LKRPSPALVISCVALFASLGGTGYAATQLPGASDAKANSKHKTTTSKPVTSAQVNKLIAKYLAAHHITGSAGPAGAPGTAGAPGKDGIEGKEGKTGPQGPGAQAILPGLLFEGQSSKVTVGPWTVTFECKAGPATTIKFAGPGSAIATGSIGALNAEAKVTKYTGNVEGGVFTVNAGNQLTLDNVFVSGTTLDDIDLQATATKGLLNICSVEGYAIPAS